MRRQILPGGTHNASTGGGGERKRDADGAGGGDDLALSDRSALNCFYNQHPSV